MLYLVYALDASGAGDGETPVASIFMIDAPECLKLNPKGVVPTLIYVAGERSDIRMAALQLLANFAVVPATQQQAGQHG
jgi:hypothetical protein